MRRPPQYLQQQLLACVRSIWGGTSQELPSIFVESQQKHASRISLIFNAATGISSPASAATFARTLTTTSSSSFRLAAAASLALSFGVLSLATAHCEEQEEEQQKGHIGRYFFLKKETRQRIFFMYEKRIRDFSSLEKIFDYFSSQERDGVKFMSPGDLLHSVIATFPPSTASGVERAGSLEGESKHNVVETEVEAPVRNSIFHLTDTNGDGLVSFQEFLLLISLMRVASKDVKIIFSMMDKDGDGSVTIDEFREMLEMLNSAGDPALSKAMAGTNLLEAATEENKETGLFDAFFGKDHTGKLTEKKFASFLGDLHEQLVHLEFCHYLPPEVTSNVGYWFSGRSGWIPGVDFARTLIMSAEQSKIRPLLAKVDAIEPKLKDMQISFAEFKSVHLDLQYKLHDIAVALTMLNHVGGTVEVEEFNRLIKKIANVQMSDQVMEVIDLMFGEESGHVNSTTFLECLQRRGVTKVMI